MKSCSLAQILKVRPRKFLAEKALCLSQRRKERQGLMALSPGPSWRSWRAWRENPCLAAAGGRAVSFVGFVVTRRKRYEETLETTNGTNDTNGKDRSVGQAPPYSYSLLLNISVHPRSSAVSKAAFRTSPNPGSGQAPFVSRGISSASLDRCQGQALAVPLRVTHEGTPAAGIL